MRRTQKHRPASSVLSTLWLCLALPACALFSAEATFTPTMPYARSLRGPGEVQIIFLGHQPVRNFARVAQLNAGRSAYSSDPALMETIRQEAARQGLDGVVDLQCAPGWSYAWQCTGTGTGFVFQR